MTSLEEHIEIIKTIEGFQNYRIIDWDSYSATIEYWVNGTKITKTFIDDGSDNWVEVS